MGPNSNQFNRYKFVLNLFRSYFHIFSSLEHALLFWITQSRHIGRISRSPKRGSPEGKEKKRGPSPLSFSHAFWTKLSSNPGLDILPLHSWLESSVERWVENSSHSFKALWAAADGPLRELISIQAEQCVITLNKWWSLISVGVYAALPFCVCRFILYWQSFSSQCLCLSYVIKRQSPNPALARAIPDQVVFSHADRAADKVLF